VLPPAVEEYPDVVSPDEYKPQEVVPMTFEPDAVE